MTHWLTHRLPLLALGLLCLAGTIQPASALDPRKALTQYVHTVWRTDDGLPQNSVTKILQTRDGFLWVGTQAGLARFDGVRFTTFDHTNTPVFRDDFISDLVEDRHGTLWIATWSDGAFTYRDGRFARVAGIGSRSGMRLAVAADDSIWIGGHDGLRKVRNGVVIKAYTMKDGLLSNEIRGIVVDKDRSVWFGSLAGLHRLGDGKIQTFTSKDGLPNNEVTSLFKTADGVLWVKTRNADIARWSHGRFEPWNIEGVAGGTVRDVLVDRDANFWLASGSEGLLRHRERRTSRFDAADGLSSDAATCMYEDRDGNLWVGTNAGGLNRFRDGSFTTYAKEEGLSADQTTSVLQDRAGDIWVSAIDGLNQFHGNGIRNLRSTDKRLDTWSMWEGRGPALLVGTSSNGVLELKDGKLARKFSARQGVPAYHVSGILSDDADSIWVATRGGGLAQIAGAKTTLFTRAQGLNSDSLYALADAGDGSLWIGSDNGLNRLKDGRIGNHSKTGNLAGAVVISLYQDSRRALWIGTFGRGLFRLENSRLTQYTTHQGLRDDTVNSIVEDASGNLWVGTDHVIARLPRQGLDAVAAGSLASLTPTVFGKADGMKSAETTGGTHPSAWRARDGRLWFPTNRGVVVVDPSQPSFPVAAPRARIEQMFADEASVDNAQAVSLPAGTRRLEIHYTAPNLSSPERTQFRYRLDGFDDEWVQGGTQRVANYTNLSPGHYSFRVSARIENGAWDPQEATLGFDLAPQFWQTWWFRLLCALAALSVIWAIYRLRVGWLHARAAVMEERQRIGSEIHDSLAQGLSGIIFQTEAALLSMPPGIASTRVVSARELAKSSLDDARYSVWELSPPVLDQKDLSESIPSMARQLTHGQVDDLEINFSGKAWATRPEANHHLVMITQEAISNAIQHGHARKIVIRLAYEANGLHLSVADNGVGFTPVAAVSTRERGYGMRNMRHRAAALGGTLDFFSEPGEGTRISLRVPRAGKLEKAWRLLLGKSIARVEA
ncbi:hypothetical protein DT603_08100 [Pseudoxanthomonas gei]|uniref:Histidine kinase domain-containing protein n=1 Tax=Pseudoxanthomonas gei TaxID=1383030 RepID=A0ABX0AHS0_9GAMM|nr:sensor histidine kinase [Pseudoxanthomonas gei]NDK38799.1 hypothetical protein [Pseudoxanthomonas gei]